jgi:hypothetical protein
MYLLLNFLATDFKGLWLFFFSMLPEEVVMAMSSINGVPLVCCQD